MKPPGEPVPDSPDAGSDLRLAISGKSGCGNTTVSRLVAEKLGLRVINYTFKNLARDSGMSFEELALKAETAVQLVRFDINEEVQRMKAHLQSLVESLGQTGQQGKKLDFICQELGREINTIGSKSVTLEIDQAVIAVKDTLEKIREQLRNVE